MTDNKIDKLIKYSGEKSKIVINNDTIPVAANPLKLSKWYDKEVKWVESQLDTLENEIEIKSICSKGCRHCCKHIIGVTKTDIIILEPFLRNLPIQNKQELFIKVKNACEKIKEAMGSEKVPIYDDEDERLYALKIKYFNANIFCPLLTNEGTCLVYNLRPSNCWAYRCYGKLEDCEISPLVEDSMFYSDWEFNFLRRFYTAKNPNKSDLEYLPFALYDLMKKFVKI